MKAKKYTDGGIGPRKKRKAAEAAKTEDVRAGYGPPAWERDAMQVERLRSLYADMKSLSEKEGISMDDAYVRYNEDNWAEDPRYEERMARIKAKRLGAFMEEDTDGDIRSRSARGGVMNFRDGGPVGSSIKGKMMKYIKGGQVDPRKKYSTKPMTPAEQKAFVEMLRKMKK